MRRTNVLWGGEPRAAGAPEGRRAGVSRLRPPPRRAEPIFRPGDRFLDFVLRRFVAKGGVAEVYEALLKGKRCALKVLQPRFQVDPRWIRRAEKEAKILIQLRHPNVIDVQDVGFDEGIFWMRMEMLDGVDLREAMHRLGPMSVALAGGWLRRAARGSHQCHVLGIIHRDIKPENIFLAQPNRVVLLDFGIAKILGDLNTVEGVGTERPAPLGTAPYMSPEQVTDAVITPASDVYALGMTSWEMLMGHHPFLPEGAAYEFWPMLQRQVHADVPKLSAFGFPAYLSRVIERALSKRWQERQPNGLAFANELDEACRRYAEEHPDEDTSPGEPALAWLVGEAEEMPSFGTGPESRPREGSGPGGPQRARRFETEPLAALEEAPEPAEPLDRDTDPMPAPPEALSRDTDPMAVPLEIRRFETVSLPPPLRDPTAIEALARYRPPRRAGVPASVALGVPARPRFGAPPLEPKAAEATARRPAPGRRGEARRSGPRPRDLAVAALLSVGWAVALVLLCLRFMERPRAAASEPPGEPELVAPVPSAASASIVGSAAPAQPSARPVAPSPLPPSPVSSGSAPPGLVGTEAPRPAAASSEAPGRRAGSAPRPALPSARARPAGREPIFTREPSPAKTRPIAPRPRKVEDIF